MHVNHDKPFIWPELSKAKSENRSDLTNLPGFALLNPGNGYYLKPPHPGLQPVFDIAKRKPSVDGCRSFRSKGLAELWEKGRAAKIDAKMHARILRRLDRLGAALRPEEVNIPGFDFRRSAQCGGMPCGNVASRSGRS